MAKVNIYGCGGCGIASAARFFNVDYNGVRPEFNIYGIDTSDSDIRLYNDFYTKNSYLFPDTDGAGQERSFIYEKALQYMPRVLTEFKPADYNIFICSTTGGTGSVVALIGMMQLIENNIPAVLICVGGGGDLTKDRNNANTLTSLNGIAKSKDSILNYIYIPHGSIADQDNSVDITISALLKPFSGKMGRLDSTDVTKWLYHSVHTGVSGSANHISILTKNDEVADVKSPLTILSLVRDRDTDVTVPEGIHYHTTGFGLDSAGIEQLHFVISEEESYEIIKKAVKRHQDSELRKKTMVRPKIETDGDDLGFKF